MFLYWTESVEKSSKVFKSSRPLRTSSLSLTGANISSPMKTTGIIFLHSIPKIFAFFFADTIIEKSLFCPSCNYFLAHNYFACQTSPTAVHFTILGCLFEWCFFRSSVFMPKNCIFPRAENSFRYNFSRFFAKGCC